MCEFRLQNVANKTPVNVEIKDVSSYIYRICKCGNNSNDDKLLFRGQANINWSLIPQIGRKEQDGLYTDLLHKERSFVEMAHFVLPKVFPRGLAPIDLLALLQHYGVPTRLLDVTENALVALYFACKELPKVNGEVIVFRDNEYDVMGFPIIDAIADSCYFIGTNSVNLGDFYENIKKQKYFTEQKWLYPQSQKSWDAGAKWIKSVCDDILFVRASNFVDRQNAQSGRYILFPNKIEEENANYVFREEIEPISKMHESIIQRIIVPHDQKKKILQELSLMGIREGTLFRDNIDKVCGDITRQIT